MFSRPHTSGHVFQCLWIRVALNSYFHCLPGACCLCAHINKAITHTLTAATALNTGGHLGPGSGLYGLRAITATSYLLWQILCQSLGNPGKLVIYLFGTLLTLSPPRQPSSPGRLSPPSSPHPFIFTSSLSSPVFPCLPPTLPSLFHSTVFLSLLVYPCAFLSLLPLFFPSSMPPTRSKTPPFVYPSSFLFSRVSLFLFALSFFPIFHLFSLFFTSSPLSHSFL